MTQFKVWLPVSLCAAGFISFVYLALSVSIPAFAVLFVIVFFTVAIVCQIPSLVNAYHDAAADHLQHKIEWQRLNLEYKRLTDETLTPSNPETVIDNADERGRLERWRAYWVAVMTWSLEHKSVVSFRDSDGNGLEAVMKHPQWSQTIVLPFIRHNPPWLMNIAQGTKTRLADGITVGHILNRLSAGDLPPLPIDDAPVFSAGEFEQSGSQEKHSQNTGGVFSAG